MVRNGSIFAAFVYFHSFFSSAFCSTGSLSACVFSTNCCSVMQIYNHFPPTPSLLNCSVIQNQLVFIITPHPPPAPCLLHCRYRGQDHSGHCHHHQPGHWPRVPGAVQGTECVKSSYASLYDILYMYLYTLERWRVSNFLDSYSYIIPYCWSIGMLTCTPILWSGATQRNILDPCNAKFQLLL